MDCNQNHSIESINKSVQVMSIQSCNPVKNQISLKKKTASNQANFSIKENFEVPKAKSLFVSQISSIENSFACQENNHTIELNSIRDDSHLNKLLRSSSEQNFDLNKVCLFISNHYRLLA